MASHEWTSAINVRPAVFAVNLSISARHYVGQDGRAILRVAGLQELEEVLHHKTHVASVASTAADSCAPGESRPTLQ